MEAAEALLIVASVARRSWNGKLSEHATADEVARDVNTMVGSTTNAQGMGRKLRVLEQAGLVERRQEDWGAMWRCSPKVRDVVKLLVAD